MLMLNSYLFPQLKQQHLVFILIPWLLAFSTFGLGFVFSHADEHVPQD